MRAGGGKNKGSAYERRVCAQLSRWITHGAKDDCLWRASMSGGRATVHHRKGSVVRQVGDIVAVSPEGHVLDGYFIECKHVKNLSLDAFFLTGKGVLANFWRIACQEATKHERTPMLIARQNRYPDLVLTIPGQLAEFLVPRPVGMVIRISQKGLQCELRLFDELLRTHFETR